MYTIIFLFVSWFHRPQHKGKIKQLVYRRIFNTESIEPCGKNLYETDWEETESSKYPDKAWKAYLQKFIVLYDNYFSKKRLD